MIAASEPQVRTITLLLLFLTQYSAGIHPEWTAGSRKSPGSSFDNPPTFRKPVQCGRFRPEEIRKSIDFRGAANGVVDRAEVR